MNVLTQALDLIAKFVILGGALYGLFGVITLAGGLKDHNGQQQSTGLWQLAGGAMIIAAAALFKTIVI
ncbi:hypothetical protein [Arcanobacterium bovis]|uniref:hypothetical protein n=1 Tax=Arcanobacterium bovis TaxID=2529275 RepID=UPI00360DE672